MDLKTIKIQLSAPFAAADIEWRIQSQKEGRAMAVPYVDNRAIQNRLDETVGPENWKNEFTPWHSADGGKTSAQLCGISIYCEDRHEWITKYDGAEDSDIEPIKGGLSDSMKRAAVQWGIGRFLYQMDFVWVDVEQSGKSWYIKRGERSKLDDAYNRTIAKLKTPDAAPKAPPTPPKAEQPKSTAPTVLPKTTTQPTAAPEPEYEYMVRTATVQAGMSGTPNTSLQLQARDGTAVRAFLRGTCPDLVTGAKLINVVMTMKTQDTVAFYIIERYEVIAEEQAQKAA